MLKTCILTVIGGLLFLASLPIGASIVSAQGSDGSSQSDHAHESISDASRRIWDGLWSGANLNFNGNAGTATTQSQTTNTSETNSPASTPRSDVQSQAPSTQASGRYVAMGDSVAAGLGLNPATDTAISATDPRCGRSDQAYPYAVAAAKQLQLSHVACSGATAGDLVTRQGVVGPNISRQISAVFNNGAQPELITVTAGANDTQWSRFIYKCYQSTCGSSVDTTIANTSLNILQTKLLAFLGEIQLRSSGQPPTVVMTGYYNPLSTSCNSQGQSQTQRLTASELAWIDANVDALNQTIEQVTGLFSFARFAPVDFSGHDVCSAEPWVQGLDDPAPIHPTAAGQQVIADAILAANP